MTKFWERTKFILTRNFDYLGYSCQGNWLINWMEQMAKERVITA